MTKKSCLAVISVFIFAIAFGYSLALAGDPPMGLSCLDWEPCCWMYDCGPGCTGTGNPGFIYHVDEQCHKAGTYCHCAAEMGYCECAP